MFMKRSNFRLLRVFCLFKDYPIPNLGKNCTFFTFNIYISFYENLSNLVSAQSNENALSGQNEIKKWIQTDLWLTGNTLWMKISCKEYHVYLLLKATWISEMPTNPKLSYFIQIYWQFYGKGHNSDYKCYLCLEFKIKMRRLVCIVC